MTSILVVDTSQAISSVALLHDGEVHCRTSEQERQAAQKILPMVQDLLDSAELQLKNLHAIAVVSGPGSFTGLRIGIGAVQGLSMSASLPVVTVSSLLLQAGTCCRRHNCRNVLVCNKARDGEVYFAAYRLEDDGDLCLLGSEQVAVPEEISLELDSTESGEHWHAVGDAWGDDDCLQRSLGISPEFCEAEISFDMAELCRLAELRFKKGESITPEQVLPNYVKEQLDYSH